MEKDDEVLVEIEIPEDEILDAMEVDALDHASCTTNVLLKSPPLSSNIECIF